MWSSTVVIVLNKEVCWSQTTFEIVSYWHGKNSKDVFISRVNTNNISYPNQKWTKIECCACSIWWNIFFIGTDYLFTSIYEFVNGNLWHQKTIGCTLQTFSIFIWTKQLNWTIFGTVSLESFESFLTIVKSWGCFWDVQSRILSQMTFIPFSVFVMWNITEWKFMVIKS